MTDSCYEGNPYKVEREKYINKIMYLISKLVETAKSTRTPDNLLWENATDFQREQILFNTDYNGHTLNSILNELINNNELSNKEIIDMNKMIENKLADIKSNNVKLKKYDSEIEGVKNLELLAEAQLNSSVHKYKSLEKKYTVLLGVLIVLILCEIGFVYFYLK